MHHEKAPLSRPKHVHACLRSAALLAGFVSSACEQRRELAPPERDAPPIESASVEAGPRALDSPVRYLPQTCPTEPHGSEAERARERVAMRLFLTGLNHDDLPGHGHESVKQRGVDALAEFIATSDGDAASIVVVLSESLGAPCDPGTKQQTPGFTRNGECLAWALEQRLGRTFTITQATHEWTDGSRVVRSGSAVITGGRWGIERGDREETIHGTWVYRPVLVDTQQVGGRRHALGLNVMHTSDNDWALPELRDTVSRAIDEFPGGDHLAPMFLGDLNFPNCDPVHANKICSGRPDPTHLPCDSEYWAPCLFDYIVGETGQPQRLDWPSRGMSCIRGHYFHADDKMHVLVGRRDGPSSFGCSVGTMRAIEATYSSLPDGQPSKPSSGAMIPGNAHNVIGLSFEIVPATPPSCGAGQVCRQGSCQRDCWCGRTTRRCGVDACGKRCGCNEGFVCRPGAEQKSWCVSNDHDCGTQSCFPGQSCCFGQCCDTATSECTTRGCEPKR